MKQLDLTLPSPRILRVEGYTDANGIRFLGDAEQQFDGTWRCLANVGGALCLVEVRVSFQGDDGSWIALT